MRRLGGLPLALFASKTIIDGIACVLMPLQRAEALLTQLLEVVVGSMTSVYLREARYQLGECYHAMTMHARWYCRHQSPRRQSLLCCTVALEMLAAGALGLLVLCNIAAAFIVRRRKRSSWAVPLAERSPAAVSIETQGGKSHANEPGCDVMATKKAADNGGSTPALTIQAIAGPAPEGGRCHASVSHARAPCPPSAPPPPTHTHTPQIIHVDPRFLCSASDSYATTRKNGALDQFPGPLQL
jgi:hypothetical protein